MDAELVGCVNGPGVRVEGGMTKHDFWLEQLRCREKEERREGLRDTLRRVKKFTLH